MSRLQVQLQIQFPYIKVLVLGVLISLLGLGEVVIGVLAFTHRIWGHYVGTGLWCGLIIFISGIMGIIVSQIRGLLVAKIYFASSVVGTLMSFVMLILSSGGLDYESNFYHFGIFNPQDLDNHHQRHNSTVMVHGLALVFSIFSFLLNIATLIICFKYVVFEKKIKYSTERTTTRKVTSPLQRSSARAGCSDTRSSTSSRAPLAERSSRRSHSRRSSDQGNRRRGEAEEFLPGTSNSDSARRNKDRHHDKRDKRHRPQRNEDKRERGGSVGSRNSRNRNERSQNQRNGIPVSVQVERIALFNGDVEEAVVHDHANDRLPTEFDEEDLPPYEEAIRDTYIPAPHINNQVLTINAHNETLRDCVHTCDIDEDKIYENVNCCKDEIPETVPIIDAHIAVRSASAQSQHVSGSRETTPVSSSRESSDLSVNLNRPAPKNEHSSGVKYVANEFEESELYVNQRNVPPTGHRSENRGKRSENRGHDRPNQSSRSNQSSSRPERNGGTNTTKVPRSTSSCNSRENGQSKRCGSNASSVSLPPHNLATKPPPGCPSGSPQQDVLETPRSDSRQNRRSWQRKIGDDTAEDGPASRPASGASKGALLNLLKKAELEYNGWSKSSRYKADYIQLQICKNPQSGQSNSETPTTEAMAVYSTASGFDSLLAHSSPRHSPSTRRHSTTDDPDQSAKGSRSNNPPNHLRLFSFAGDSRKPSTNPPCAPVAVGELKTSDGVATSAVSPVSVDMSGFSPVGFSSPTSAFKPYKRGDSASSSAVGSPVSDSEQLSVSATLPLTGNKVVQRQSSWKDFMLPSAHSKSDQSRPSVSSEDTRQLSAVASQPIKPDSSISTSTGSSISTSTSLSISTFPRPTPPVFRVPPLSSQKNYGSFRPGTALTSTAAKVPASSCSTGSNVAVSSCPVTDAQSRTARSSSHNSGPVSEPASSSASTRSSCPAYSSASRNVFRFSSSSPSASRNSSVTYSSSSRPIVSAVEQTSTSARPSAVPAVEHVQRDLPSGGPNTYGLAVAVSQSQSSSSVTHARSDPTQGNSRGQGQESPRGGDNAIEGEGHVIASIQVVQPIDQHPVQQPQDVHPLQQQQQQQQQGKPLFSILL